MTEMVAYCGLICRTCPILLATTQKNKEEQARMRAEIVRLCEEHYGLQYTVEDITDCDGCMTEGGRLFSAGRNCAIRMCARDRKLENCAYCSEYVCATLEAFFRTETAARTRLEAIRNSIRQRS
jgi:hypothetical protein